jgi:hypothetical protein
VAADTPTVEETLAREARGRTGAGVAAIVAAVLTLGGSIGSSIVYKDIPHIPLLRALQNTGIPSGLEKVSLRTAQLTFLDHHSAGLLVTTIALALGSLAIAGALLYLYAAAKARRPETPGIARYAALGGPVLVGVGQTAFIITRVVKAHHFVTSTDHSHQAAKNALEAGAVIAAQTLSTLGALVVALAFVVVSLNAMRAGLLTRFMGVLGMLVGVLFVIPLGSPWPVVQAFWLLAFGALVLGLAPAGRPPAWESGQAEPWPTQQELREQREAARTGAAPPERAPAQPAETADAVPAPAQHSSSKKKRKRRR